MVMDIGFEHDEDGSAVDLGLHRDSGAPGGYESILGLPVLGL